MTLFQRRWPTMANAEHKAWEAVLKEEHKYLQKNFFLIYGIVFKNFVFTINFTRRLGGISLINCIVPHVIPGAKVRVITSYHAVILRAHAAGC